MGKQFYAQLKWTYNSYRRISNEDACWVEPKPDDRLVAWLAEAYKSSGQKDEALLFQRKRLKRHPSLPVLLDILELTPEDERQATRAELVEVLKEQGYWELLVRLYMAEEAWSEAWKTATT